MRARFSSPLRSQRSALFLGAGLAVFFPWSSGCAQGSKPAAQSATARRPSVSSQPQSSNSAGVGAKGGEGAAGGLDRRPPRKSHLGDKAGALTLDKHVRAPWSRQKKYYPGKVAEFYGKLAFIHFDDGDRGWAKITELKPPGTPLGDPPVDTNHVAVGSRVICPWSHRGGRFRGKISAIYGKLAHVNFDDGDQAWVLAFRCERLLN